MCLRKRPALKLRGATLIIGFMALLWPGQYGCSKQEWQGQVTKNGTLTTVKNPNRPLYPRYNILLSEEFSIGTQDNDNYRLHQARTLALDSQENIYVLDAGNYRIQIFNPQGMFVRTIGRVGQGPGEIPEPPFSFAISPADEIFIVLMRNEKIIQLSKEGKYLKTLKIPLGVFDFFVGTHGNYFAKRISYDDSGREVRSVIRINSTGEIDKEYFRFTKGAGEASNVNADLALFYAKSQLLIWGVSTEPCIEIVSPEGRERRRVCWNIGPLEFSEAEKERFSEQRKRMPIGIRDYLEPPEYREFVHSVIMDDSGFIWVASTPNYENRVFLFDVFDPQGRYLFRFALKYLPLVIQNGYIYSMIQNPELGPIVQKVRMENWPPENLKGFPKYQSDQE